MKNKLRVLLTTLIFAIGTPSVAQDTTISILTKSIKEFLGFVSSIDASLSSINDREKLKKLYRNLGDVLLDIQDVGSQKERIANELNANGYFSGNKYATYSRAIDKEIDVLILSINMLKASLKELSPFIAQIKRDDFLLSIDKISVYYSTNAPRWEGIKNAVYSNQQMIKEIELSKQINIAASESVSTIRSKILAQLSANSGN